MKSKNAFKSTAALAGSVSLAALLIVPLLALAQPQAGPPYSNVDATFNSVTIRSLGVNNLKLSSDGSIGNLAGAVRVNDADGLFVNGTSGIGPVLTVTGHGTHNAVLHSDGWITGTGGFHLGGNGSFSNSNFVIFPDGKIQANNGPVTIWDADGLDVRGPITNKGGQLTLEDFADGIMLSGTTTVNSNLNAYGTVSASEGAFTYHARARRIGNFTWSKLLYVTMPPNAFTDFEADTSSGALTCAKDSIAITCGFEAYEGTGGCAGGSPTGALNKNAVYPTYIRHEPIRSSSVGGTCSVGLYNKTGNWLCGKVKVVCWDTDGTL